MKASRQITMDEAAAILDRAVAAEVGRGWRVVSRTDATAQLVRDRGANGCVAILLLAFLVVPGILYLLLYKGQRGLYLEVDGAGRVRRIER